MASQAEFYVKYDYYFHSQTDEPEIIRILDYNPSGSWSADSASILKGPMFMTDLKSELEGSPAIITLRLKFKEGTLAELDELAWLSFCQTVQECLPSLVKLWINAASIGDIKCQTLLQHLPSTLQSMRLFGVNWNCPLTIQQIGKFPLLRELWLVFQKPSLIIAENIKMLAKTVGKLTCLEKFYLERVPKESLLETWKPVVDVLCSNSQLKRVKVYDWHNQDLSQHVPGLEFGPRLNKAKEKYLSGEEISAKNFVDALISVRDRVDCLDHLLSETDPNLYAKHVIGEDR